MLSSMLLCWVRISHMPEMGVNPHIFMLYGMSLRCDFIVPHIKNNIVTLVRVCELFYCISLKLNKIRWQRRGHCSDSWEVNVRRNDTRKNYMKVSAYTEDSITAKIKLSCLYPEKATAIKLYHKVSSLNKCFFPPKCSLFDSNIQVKAVSVNKARVTQQSFSPGELRPCD